jgi:hypothetical protein
MQFSAETVLMGLAQGNRILWSAAESGRDLYLPTPMSRLVSRKLMETNDCRGHTRDLIESLKSEVDFPDVRVLVNSGALSLEDVLKLRSKAGRFRRWLQTESERDRNAILAYHNEVAKESGFTSGLRKTLAIGGMLGGAGVGAAVAASIPDAPIVGPVVGAAAGGLTSYLSDVAAKMNAGWKPVIFGDWARDFVEQERTDR